MKSNDAVLAIFSQVDKFLECLKLLKEKDHSLIEAFSPVRLPEMQEIITPKPSITRTFTLAGGVIGALGLVALACFAHLSFRLIVYGKPVLAWIPWVLVAFEGTILFASLFAFVSWVFKAGLPQPETGPGYSATLSGHKFGILVSAKGDNIREIEDMLKENGAEEVSRVSS